MGVFSFFTMPYFLFLSPGWVVGCWFLVDWADCQAGKVNQLGLVGKGIREWMDGMGWNRLRGGLDWTRGTVPSGWDLGFYLASWLIFFAFSGVQEVG